MDKMDALLKIMSAFRKNGAEPYTGKADWELIEMAENLLREAERLRQEEAGKASQDSNSKP